MMTLQEKKNQIFEFLKGKKIKNKDIHLKWLNSLNIFHLSFSISNKQWITLNGGYKGKRNLIDLYIGSLGSESFIQFSKVQKFIQETLLKDTYIKVNSQEESKWVQELLFSIGIVWCDGNRKPNHLSARQLIIMQWESEPYHLEYNNKWKTSKDYYQIDIPYLETLFGTKFETKEHPEYIPMTICQFSDKTFTLQVKPEDAEKVLRLINQGYLVDEIQKKSEYLENKLWNKSQLLEKTESLLADANHEISSLGSVVEDLTKWKYHYEKLSEIHQGYICQLEQKLNELKQVMSKEVSHYEPF